MCYKNNVGDILGRILCWPWSRGGIKRIRRQLGGSIVIFPRVEVRISGEGDSDAKRTVEKFQ